MKHSRGVVTGLVLAAVLIIIWASGSLLNTGGQQRPYSVSVIVEGSSLDRWRALKEGLEQGAEEGDVVLNVVPTSSFSDLSDEIDVIRRELENGADGIIAEPCADDSQGELADSLSATKAVLIGSEVTGENRLTCVSADGYRLGSRIARLVMEAEETDSGTTFGILSGNQEIPMMKSCLQGFQETLGARDQVRWSISEKGLSTESLLKLSMEAKPVDILVALDNDAMEKGIDLLLEQKKVNCHLYGEGRSEKCVYYLDKGLVSGMVVPDEFMMGYESMRLLLQQLEYHVTDGQSGEIGMVSVTRESLHDQETAGIIFPTVR